MAAAVRSKSTVATGSRTNTTVTAPSGIQNGDVLLCLLDVGNSSSPAVTPPTGFAEATPTGWPLTFSASDPWQVKVHLYTKVASSESGNYTFSHSTAYTEACMYAISGADTSAPLTPNPTHWESNDWSGQTTITAPGLNTPRDSSLVIFTGSDWNGMSTSPPTGTTPTFTEDYDGGASGVFYVASGVLTSAGATGNKSITIPDGKAAAAGLICVQAAAASGSVTTTWTAAGPGSFAGQVPSSKLALFQQIPAGAGAFVGQTLASLIKTFGLPPAGLLSGTGYAPTTTWTTTALELIPAGALAALGYVPSSAWTTRATEAIPQGALAALGYAPDTTWTTRAIEAIPAGAGVFTGYATSATWTTQATEAIPAGALAATGYAPTSTRTSRETEAIPAGAGAFVGYTFTATWTTRATGTLPQGAGVLTGYGPVSVTTSAGATAIPAGAGALTGYAPTTVWTTHATSSLPAGAIVALGYVPDTSWTAHLWASLVAGALVAEGYAPQSLTGAQVITDIDAGLLALEAYAPESTYTALGPVLCELPVGEMALEGEILEALGGEQVSFKRRAGRRRVVHVNGRPIIVRDEAEAVRVILESVRRLEEGAVPTMPAPIRRGRRAAITRLERRLDIERAAWTSRLQAEDEELLMLLAA